jgi:hypothetical protein
MDDFDAIKEKVRAAATGDPPEPWGRLGTVHFGGLTEVGFAEDSELLLVLSGHGRGVIDCRTGRNVARDMAPEDPSTWYGHHDLIGHGIGPLRGREIRLAGASGGGLLAITRDGWGAVRMAIDWPDECLLLDAPFCSIYQPAAPFWKLGVEREVLAYGFSYTGKSLVWATSEGVTIFRRDESE